MACVSAKVVRRHSPAPLQLWPTSVGVLGLLLGCFNCQPGDAPSFDAQSETASSTITPGLVGTLFLDASLIESKFTGLLKESLQTKTKQTIKLTVNTIGITEEQDPDATFVWCHEMASADGSVTIEPLCTIGNVNCTGSEWQSEETLVSTATVLLGDIKGLELVKEDHAIVAVLTSAAQASANAAAVCKQPPVLLEPIRVEFSITTEVQGGMPQLLLPTGKGCVTREQPIFANIPGVKLGDSASYAVTWKVNGTAAASNQKGCVAGGTYSLCSGANINNALGVCSLKPTQFTKGDVVQVCVRICEVDDVEIQDDEVCSEPLKVCDAWPDCTTPTARLLPPDVNGTLICSAMCTDADDDVLYADLTFGPLGVEEPNWAETNQQGPYYYTAGDGAVDVAVSIKLSEQNDFQPAKGTQICCRLRPYGSESNVFPEGGLPYPHSDGVLDKSGDPPCVVVANSPPTVSNVFITPNTGTVGTEFTCTGLVSDPDVADLAKLNREFVWFSPANPTDHWMSSGASEKFPAPGQTPSWLKESTQLCCRLTVTDSDGAQATSTSGAACANLTNSAPTILTDAQPEPIPIAQWSTNVWNTDADPGGDVCFDKTAVDAPGSGATQIYPWHEAECFHTFAVVDEDNTLPVKSVLWYHHVGGLNYVFLAEQTTLVPALTKPDSWDFNNAQSSLPLACKIRWCDAAYPDVCVESDYSPDLLVAPVPPKAKRTCDDKKMCTSDSCDQSLSCQFVPQPGFCDDSDACTEGDLCVGADCIAGNPIDCTDNNPCTEDYCDPKVGCINQAGSKICDDGNACTEMDTCDATGKCIGKPVVCDDKNQCTTDSCDLFDGCLFAPKLGNPCDDNDICTASDECKNGVCQGITMVCNDNNTCTTDNCDPEKGCQYKNKDNGTPCDDNKPCTSADGQPDCKGDCDSCSAGICYGKPVVCQDNNLCTNDYCDEAVGCQHIPNTAFCNDNNPCTQNDQCTEKACVGAAVVCNDNNPCTTDSCSPASGCIFTPNTLSCNDGNACTTNDVCSNGKCGGTLVDCSAQLGGVGPCEIVLCDPKVGCLAPIFQQDGGACDDSDACTTNDQCFAGQCAGTPIVCTNLNACSVATGVCDPIGGCQYAPPPGGICEDGNPCTSNDKCVAGACNAGVPTVCDDKNVCTNDACDPKSGCIVTNNMASCDDGNACTAPDSCQNGKCNPGPTKVCNDGNVCTSDACDPVKGCTYDNLSGTACNDNNACTESDICTSGKCGGQPIVCNDNNGCTNDSCVPSTGCVYSNANGTPCNDSNPCTISDQCNAGKCTGATNPCNDNQVCTSDSCNPASGCVHTNVGGSCNDGSECTTGDSCSQGKCGGTPKADGTGCNDGNSATTGDQCLGGKCVGTTPQVP